MHLFYRDQPVQQTPLWKALGRQRPGKGRLVASAADAEKWIKNSPSLAQLGLLLVTFQQVRQIAFLLFLDK